MKRWITSLFALILTAALIGMPVLASAQQGPGASVTITGQRGDAAGRCDAVTPAGGSVGTVTLNNPGAGLSDYITAVGTFALVSAAAATNVLASLPTVTGLTGTSASIGFPLASATTAALTLGAVSGGWMVLSTPVKANANTAATVNSGTAITGAQGAVIVCYYSAP